VHLVRPHKATGMFGNKMIRNSNDEESEELYRIDSVEIVITNGCIRKNGLKVMLSNKRVYRNRNAPITLYTFENRKADYLLADSLGEKFGLRVGQIINYIYNEKFNYPSDQVAHLGPAKGTDSLYVGTTVGELLDVNIFSDLLALLGRKPNGIIQTQVTATFITNSGNVKNHDITFNNTIKAYFKLSKMDSKFAQLDSNAFANKAMDTIKRLYLNQTAYLQAGLKDNVVRVGVGSNQQLLLNIGSEISLTNADSLYHKDIITINYFTELEHTISRLDNFGLETSARFIYQWVANSAPFNNKKSIWIFNPQVVIYYYPFSNPNNKIYVRYAHYSQLGDGRYNYPQFQFGFKTNLFSQKSKSE
jgi:hypothetical protein